MRQEGLGKSGLNLSLRTPGMIMSRWRDKKKLFPFKTRQPGAVESTSDGRGPEAAPGDDRCRGHFILWFGSCDWSCRRWCMSKGSWESTGHSGVQCGDPLRPQTSSGSATWRRRRRRRGRWCSSPRLTVNVFLFSFFFSPTKLLTTLR